MSESNAKDNALLFLNEKFTPAELPEVCAPRRELLRRFHKAAEERFVYVGAPAGSGKTVSTLLWLHACDRKVVWLGLDKYDDTPSVFYKLLATGVFSLQPENENLRKILMAPSFTATPVEHMVQLLSEMLPETDRYALVLDDMHLIENGEILKSLPAVLKRLPRSFTVLILSRREIPDEFRPLLKDEEVQLITPELLRFSEDEIRRYFGSVGRFLTPEESKFAYMATDGWAIGVNAIAKSGQIELGGGHYIFSAYFEQHLWNGWGPALRDFCLKTSVVDEFDPELARRLSGREDAAVVMETLSRTNNFLSRLHEDTYRYHHLFQDFLREKAAAELKLSPLYKEAANYYRDHKDYTRALRFWFQSGDYKEIDTLLFLFLFRGYQNGVADYADFLHVFFAEELPERAAREAPALHVLYAWYYYLTSRHEDYARHMDAIIRNLPRIAAAGNEFVEFAILAFHVDYRKSLKKQVSLFHLFGKMLKSYTPEGLATRIASFTHNLPYMHRSNRDYSEMALNPGILNKLDTTFAPLLGAEWTYLRPGLLTCFEYERNHLETALTQITEVLALLTEESKPDGRICVLLLKHSILWQLGRVKEATEVMDELSAFVEASAQYFLPNLTAYQTKLRLLNGDVSAAREWLDRYFVMEIEHIEFFRSFQHFTTARAYLALGEMEKAERLIHMLEAFGRDLNRPLDEGEALILSAALKWAKGDKKGADAALESALTLLQPYGYIRIFADEGACIQPILKRLTTRVDKEGYSGALKREYLLEVTLACHTFAREHKGVTANLLHPDKPVKLSKQQAMVLSMLSKGYKNAEICEQTGLSLPTIKSHTAVAYRKLHVNNAMDAILKARELGLI